jgi:hypothetical protein
VISTAWHIEARQKFRNLKTSSEKRKLDCTIELWRAVMPNQKQRKKKQGTNKGKKIQAMRAKEARAKPAEKPTATGKRPGQTSKFEILQDRPGAFRRA